MTRPAENCKPKPVLMPNVATVELLLKYYYSGENIPLRSQTLQEANQFLIKHGLIDQCDSTLDFRTTDRGVAWITFILQRCPLPVEVTSYRVEVVENGNT